MADDSAARKSKRPPRGSRSLGAVRKGAEGNATTATPRNGTREPLLSKQTPAYDNDWDEDDWGDSNWGDNGGRPGKPYHQPQSFSGNHTLPYSSSSRPRTGGGGSRLGSLSNRGRTCVTAMVVVMLVIGVSFTISGNRYRGRSSETQKTMITSSTMQRENSNNSNNKSSKENEKSAAAAVVDDLEDDFQAIPDLEEERKSAGGGSHLHDWDEHGLDTDDNRDGGIGHDGGIEDDLDYADENGLDNDDNRDGGIGHDGGIGDDLDYADENDAAHSTIDFNTTNGVWGTAQKSSTSTTISRTANTNQVGGVDERVDDHDNDDDYPGSITASAAPIEQEQQHQSRPNGTSNTQQQQQQQKQGVQQYDTDYDADYDTPPKANRTRDGGGEEEDNSELVDSRGWSGEDVGAAAEEGFEGDGSFSDGDDVAEMRGEQELEDEEDYGPLRESAGDGDGFGNGRVDNGENDDGLEDGEESHFLGRKPDERPLTGGQDWEGDNAAALVNEGEGEEREGSSNGGGGGDYDGENHGEEEEEKDGEYDYEGNPVDSLSGSSSSDTRQLHPHDSTAFRTTGAGQRAGGEERAAPTTTRAARAGTQFQKTASGGASALVKSSSSLEDSEVGSDFNTLDLEDVDPFTAEKLIEQQEIKQLEDEDGAGAFSSARSGGNDNTDFLDAFDAGNEYSNEIGFNELASRDPSTTTAGSVGAGAVPGKRSSTTTGAAAGVAGGHGIRVQPGQGTNKGSRTTPSAHAGNVKPAAVAAGAVGGADLWNEDYAGEEQHIEKEEHEQSQDFDYSAGDDAASVPRKAGGVGDVSLHPVKTANADAKAGAGATTQDTVASSRPGATKSTNNFPTSTAASGVQKRQQAPGKRVASGSGAQQQRVQQKRGNIISTTTAANKAGTAAASTSASITSTVTKQQGSASNTTVMASSTKSTVISGALKKANATSTSTTTSTVAGEARNRRAGSAGGVLPGHGGEEPPENRIEPIKVGSNKPGEKPSVADAIETEGDFSSTNTASTSSSGSGTTATSGSSKPSSKTASSSLEGAAAGGQIASVLPIGPKNTAEAMIHSQKLVDGEEEEDSNIEDGGSAREKSLPAAGIVDDEEEEEMEKVDLVKSSTKSPPASSSKSSSTSASSGSKSSSEKPPFSSSTKKQATSSIDTLKKSSTSSKSSSSSSSSGKKSNKGMRRSLRSELPVVRLKKYPQPYGEEDHQVGEGKQRRKRTVTV
ncbi:hypothetical protein Ndes2526B_g05108 [Nannochloris sp. 'desiccata']|nr:hypothetical protein KSW81_000040 [Chlorella desiccata (nom. nud.)]KAH7619863.1 hypothetical protein NADE_008141 [Chlorella desiccata (nom. nud.)]